MVGRTRVHYRVLRRVGGGGMGEVYEAEDLRLGRHVALKVLPPSLSGDPQAVERLRREARAASALNHRHICTIHDIGEHDGQQFIVMELLEGQTLRELIAGGPLDLPMLLDIGVQVTDALEAAHAAGIVHRDVKPANIFLTSPRAVTGGTEDGRPGEGAWVKLLDFGVAKAPAGMRSSTVALADAQLPTLTANEPLTGPATALGTITYMSPEQALGEDLDGRTDLFSLGVVLYEMAAGQVPFAGRTPAALFDAILHQSPTPVTHLNARVPRELEWVIERALEKDRARRYQSAADLRTDLLHVKRGSGGERPAVAPVSPATAASQEDRGGAARHRWRRRAIVTAMSAIAVAAIAAGVYLYSQRAPALTDRDVILLADWVNTTGDSTFDDALKPALAAELQQSPFLSILSQERVRSALRFMRRSPDERVTPSVAREVCQREAVKAMLGGSIAAVGTHYSIALEATNCATGDSLATEAVEATSKEEVLAAVGRAASGMRRKLGSHSRRSRSTTHRPNRRRPIHYAGPLASAPPFGVRFARSHPVLRVLRGLRVQTPWLSLRLYQRLAGRTRTHPSSGTRFSSVFGLTAGSVRSPAEGSSRSMTAAMPRSLYRLNALIAPIRSSACSSRYSKP